ncbi:hypothetical protein [Sporichthya polymorpha]|uniref:hypothetical protein n=1 Tax=Sporichthya polymorpha TaxID=35751 RepID=UPI00037A91F3|nr:hypothetical protein [Sporichthya polymorpha]
MKRSLALSTGSALVATAVGVTGFLVAGGSAGAQATARTEARVAAAGSGAVVVCHQGLGKHKALNSGVGIESLESGTAISGTSTEYRRARGCRALVRGVEERTRVTAFYRVKSPFRLKSVTVKQTDGTKVTFRHNSHVARVLLDEREDVTITYRWVRPKRR